MKPTYSVEAPDQPRLKSARLEIEHTEPEFVPDPRQVRPQ